MRLSGLWLLGLTAVTGIMACSSGDARSSNGSVGAAPDPAEAKPPRDARFDRFDVPLARIAPDFAAAFNDGDLLFSTPLRAADGLGPLYTRSACSSCHEEAARGPGVVQKMSVVEADGVTPSLDQSKLEFGHTVHPLVIGDGLPILPPVGDANVRVTTRIGPPVLGRGYIEAVADSEIERMEAEQATRTDGIHGHVNHVIYASEANIDTRFASADKGDTVIGRFGLKARIPNLDDFTADAFQGDMGITSPLRPNEFVNPSGITDDGKPGVDVDYDSVNLRAMYVRLLAIPARPSDANGAALFESTTCSVCHAPSLGTRADYAIPELAGIGAAIYSDLLLHDMGSDLADGLPSGASTDGQADSFEWRSAPLMGLRFNRTYMHDGRAKTVEEAILAHRGPGSEANAAVDSFEALPDADRAALVAFVQAL